MLHWIRNLAVFFSVGLLAACQSSSVVKLYDGAERPASQVAVVQVPETLDILTINDRSPAGINNSFVAGHREMHLSPGSYQIVAYYQEIWEPDTTSSHEVLRSEPVIFTLNSRAGGRYILEYNRPDDVDEARELAANFRGWIRDTATGERFDSEPSGMARPGLLSNVNIGGVAPVASNPVVLPTPVNAPAATVPAPSPVPTDSVGGNAYLDMLKAYWSQASAEERRTFLLWIAEQD
ncbi:MAG: DUF2057 domain-containing protein [Porticoccaceae bacterium]|nr:DUF2057 domain-containing protein [Porticoccaceae bacterium]